MNIYPLGGANEVGGSCSPINIDGYCILVDAGIRMNRDQPLPDFSMFNRCGMPDAVLITHVHTDHTGALPILHNMLSPDVKIYCTPPTKAITKVLLEDNVRRMECEEQDEGKSPLYTRADVAAVLNRMELVSWLDPVEICPGVTARWIRAGHILGAAMIYIEGRNESILITGDVSVSKQLTIPSVDVPSWCKPDVMVMESTYGKSPHKVSREQEAKRLAEDVTKVVADGGKVLIPVFAIGRSQEVILILKDAMERGEIPKFPVYVDGMVRDVNTIYSQFAHELQRPLRRKAEHGESLFYSHVIKKIPRGAKPESILAEGPCCIVASSGMLKGGKSTIYAKHLIGNPKNLIAITGYQAEGTPGRALEDIKGSENRVWFLDDERFDVKCCVKRYSLSAHADRDQLMRLVKKVQPRKLLLVHGDDGAQKGLFKSVRENHPDILVELPKNGETYTVKKHIGLAAGRHFANDRILSELSTFLQRMGWEERSFSIRDLAEMWFGTEIITAVMIKFFEWCLSLDGRFFERKSEDLFHLRQPI